jgi:SpoVK/Ycf46/Vps4 family AAA+-type ATPase
MNRKEKAEIQTMLAARSSLIVVKAPEEKIAERELRAIAFSRHSSIYFWDLARGWDDSNQLDFGIPMDALERIRKAPNEPAIFVLKDVSTLIEPSHNSGSQLALIREIKNLSRDISRDKRTIILLTNDALLPPELKEEAEIVQLSFPSVEQISILLNNLSKKTLLSILGREELVRACQGLTEERITRTIAKCLAKGKIDASAIADIIAEKRKAVLETGILEFIEVSGKATIGGLTNLKRWVKFRTGDFTQAARDYGLPLPKGILIVGAHGTGKSTAVKLIAYEWNLPLVRLDVGRLFGSLFGESEARTRKAIQLIESIAPAILFIDEIDKCFSINQEGDSGTSKRVLATLLTWMQENASIFVTMTANSIELLPPELIRKGRIDEIFWVSLPTKTERMEIFNVHLSKVRDVDFDLELLASRASGCSGADIEQIIWEAMRLGFNRGEEFCLGDLLQAIAMFSRRNQNASDEEVVNEVKGECDRHSH